MGALLVSATHAGGQVTEVTIVSERGRPCRIANPFPGETTVTDSVNTPVPCEVENDILAFNTAPDETYQLRRN